MLKPLALLAVIMVASSEASTCDSPTTCWNRGFRNFEDTDPKGQYECPRGTTVREEWDCHEPSAQEMTELAMDCCRSTCWLAGWRNDGDSSGSQTCPAGKMARDEYDMHILSAGSDPQTECCRTNCWNEGWRSSEDDTGTAKFKCPSNFHVRGEGDFHPHHPDAVYDENQCCYQSCQEAGFTDATTCPAGASLHESGHCDGACTQSDCCQATCSSRTTPCPAGLSTYQPTHDSDFCRDVNCPDSECCGLPNNDWTTTCWQAGFGTTISCPAGTRPREEHDHHMSQFLTAHDCCQPHCEDWDGINQCPAGTAPQLHSTCHAWDGQKRYCNVDSCCKPTCRTAFPADGCPADKILTNLDGSCWDTGTTKGCTEDHCCKNKPTPGEWNCWYHGDDGKGWRPDGDSSTGKMCPPGTRARGDHDGHMMGRPAADYTQEQCCPRTCWSAGWRDAGDSSADPSKTCPAGSSARSEHDGHDCSGSDCAQAWDCCQPTCGGAGYSDATVCPAGTTFKSSGHNCHSSEARASGVCPLYECCEQTCEGAGFTQDKCPAGMMLVPPSDPTTGMSTFGYTPKCKTPDCSPTECCYIPNPDSTPRTCYEAGFRDIDSAVAVAAGTFTCPAGHRARGQDDGHRCGSGWMGLHNGACFAGDCCFLSCYSSGWRNDGDSSGSQMCPAGLEARDSDSGFHCQGSSCTRDECCTKSCAEFTGVCPAGKQPAGEHGRCNGAECNAESCCYVGCQAWHDADPTNNVCPAGQSLDENDGCDNNNIAGCNVDKCCEEPSPCDSLCASFDTECNRAWDSSRAECANASQCEPNCDDENLDYYVCKAGLEQCVDCTPAPCEACINCYASSLGILLDNAPCEDNDARVLADSQGAVTSCAAGLAVTWTDGSVLNLCNAADAATIGAPAGWFNQVCCATCTPQESSCDDRALGQCRAARRGCYGAITGAPVGDDRIHAACNTPQCTDWHTCAGTLRNDCAGADRGFFATSGVFVRGRESMCPQYGGGISEQCKQQYMNNHTGCAADPGHDHDWSAVFEACPTFYAFVQSCPDGDCDNTSPDTNTIAGMCSEYLDASQACRNALLATPDNQETISGFESFCGNDGCTSAPAGAVAPFAGTFYSANACAVGCPVAAGAVAPEAGTLCPPSHSNDDDWSNIFRACPGFYDFVRTCPNGDCDNVLPDADQLPALCSDIFTQSCRDAFAANPSNDARATLFSYDYMCDRRGGGGGGGGGGSGSGSGSGGGSGRVELA